MLVRIEGDLLEHIDKVYVADWLQMQRTSFEVVCVYYLFSELAVEPYGFKTPPVLKVCYLHL